MRIEDLMEDTHLFEMSNFRKNETGLPMNIYVSSGSGLNYKLPRIKAMVDSSDKMNIRNTISIILKHNITDDDIVGYHKLPASNLSALCDFINLNYDVLIQYWNDEISTTELTQKIQRLP
jgi:hypothetical protein